MRKWKVAVGLIVVCTCSLAFARTPLATPGEKAEPAQNPQKVTQVATVDGQQSDDAVIVQPVVGYNATGGGLRGATCDSAETLPCGGSITVTLTGNTQSNPAFSCKNGNTHSNFGFDPKWYKFQATSTGAVVSTCTAPGSGMPVEPDTLVAVYSGTCASLTEIGCADDNCGYPAFPSLDPWMSRASVTGLTVGNWYYIQLAKWYPTSETPDNDGTYVISLQCCEPPAAITCWSPLDPNANQYEFEMNPCSANTQPNTVPWLFGTYDVNGGCNAEHEPFTEILQCNSWICGSSTALNSAIGTLTRDLDWYRFKLEIPAKIEFTVNAEFGPEVWIDKAYPCDIYRGLIWNTDVAGLYYNGLAHGEGSYCSPTVTVKYPDDPNNPNAVAEPGVYWFIVAPSFQNGEVPCTKPYRAFLKVTPCDTQFGTCCIGGTCTDGVEDRESCLAQSGIWYGVGTHCYTPETGGVQCWACPAGPKVTIAAEPAAGACNTFPYVFTDSTNMGCANTASPKFTLLSFTDPNFPGNTAAAGTLELCGISGTHLNANPPTANARDNDWYMLGTNTLWPVGVVKTVIAEVKAEFPVQLALVAPGYPAGNECATTNTTGNMTFVSTRFGAPGETVRVSNCMTAQDSFASRGRAWVVVRPALYGTPYNLPCGMRYSLKVQWADGCTGTGACCYSAGCDIKTKAQCTTLGGAWYGDGSVCSEICCACAPTHVAEGETGCAGVLPDGYNSGCLVPTGTPIPAPPLTNNMVAGTWYCGKAGWQTVPASTNVRLDIDAYKFTLASRSSVRINYYGEFMLDFFIAPVPNNVCPDPLLGWTIRHPALRTPCREGRFTLLNADAGVYHLSVNEDFDDSLFSDCNDGPYLKYELMIETPGLTGACCLPDGSCSEIWNAAECASQGGSYKGDEVECLANTCVQSGACCVGTTCTVETPAACATAGGTYKGDDVPCTPTTCGIPLCAGDGNCDGVIDWRDIDFLVAAQNDNETAWADLFPGTPPCQFLNNDANGDDHVDWRDIDPFVALMNTVCAK